MKRQVRISATTNKPGILHTPVIPADGDRKIDGAQWFPASPEYRVPWFRERSITKGIGEEC